MKRLFTICIFLYINSSAAEWEFNGISPYRHSINLSSNYFFESNAITNRFALAYLNNEFIDNQKKDVVSKKLNSENRFGSGFNNAISYSRYNDTVFGLPQSGYSITLKDITLQDCQFSKDVFELYFRGNKSYAGKTAYLNDFFVQQLMYRKLNFIFAHEYKSGTDKFGFAAGIDLNFGRTLFHIVASQASIYTDTNGEYIDLKANLDIHLSDSSDQASFLANNGFGTSGNFHFYWSDKRNSELNLYVDGFGFIKWNEQSTFVHADTSFRFEGIDISNVFLFTDTIHESISVDSSLVEPYLTNREKKSFSFMLPAPTGISYRYFILPAKLDVRGEISYLLFGHAKIQESLALRYSFMEGHRISIKATNGGYSNFRVGLSGSFILGKQWLITIGSDQLSESIKSDGNAQGAFVSLTAYF